MLGILLNGIVLCLKKIERWLCFPTGSRSLTERSQCQIGERYRGHDFHLFLSVAEIM